MKNAKLYKTIAILCTSSIILSGCQSNSTMSKTNDSMKRTNQQQETLTTESSSEHETLITESTAEQEMLTEKENTTIASSEESYTLQEETLPFDNFNSERQDIQASIQNEDTTTMIEKGKTIFINAVDFIFYDKEYKGVTFNELTEEAKKQTYDNLCIIDGWIMNISPSYKESIGEKYTIVKDFLSEKGYFVLNKIKQYIGDENYEAIGDIKNAIIDNIQDAGQKIKEKASDWYQTFKEKNQ